MAKHANIGKKETKKVKRRDVIAKTKTSRLKNSIHYKKKYRGQGR